MDLHRVKPIPDGKYDRLVNSLIDIEDRRKALNEAVLAAALSVPTQGFGEEDMPDFLYSSGNGFGLIYRERVMMQKEILTIVERQGFVTPDDFEGCPRTGEVGFVSRAYQNEAEKKAGTGQEEKR